MPDDAALACRMARGAVDGRVHSKLLADMSDGGSTVKTVQCVDGG
jgi:hypothetical protein